MFCHQLTTVLVARGHGRRPGRVNETGSYRVLQTGGWLLGTATESRVSQNTIKVNFRKKVMLLNEKHCRRNVDAQ